MKTIITIAAALVFTFVNDVFAFDPYDGGTPRNQPQFLTFGFGYSGNPYYSNNPYFGNPSCPHHGHPHHGHPHHGHPQCGGAYNNTPYYGNGFPGGHPTPNHTGYGHPYIGNNPYNPNMGGQYPGNHFVNENSFNNFINALDNEAFDNNKLKMAQFYASSAVLNVQQIGRILEKFTFDSNRLKFAKSAYNNCYDKYNYVLLRSHFTFSSNFEELMNDVGY